MVILSTSIALSVNKIEGYQFVLQMYNISMTPDNKLGISRWFDLPNGDALTEAVTNLNKKDLAHIDVNFVRSRISSYEEGEQITKKQAVQLENHLRNIQGKRKIIS